MSALQPWLKFNAMAHHKTEKLTYQILFNFFLHLQLFFRFSSFSSVHPPCSSSSFSASLLSRPSIILRVAAPMRMMIDCRASRVYVLMGEINKSTCIPQRRPMWMKGLEFGGKVNGNGK